MFGSLFELAFFSKAITQKQCFMEIALLNVKTYIQKLSYVFYCNFIYTLKFIKQNVIFCSFIQIKMIFKGNNSCMNKCSHGSSNHNVQFFKIKFQNNFRPIAIFCFFFNYCIITNVTSGFPI